MIGRSCWRNQKKYAKPEETDDHHQEARDADGGDPRFSRRTSAARVDVDQVPCAASHAPSFSAGRNGDVAGGRWLLDLRGYGGDCRGEGDCNPMRGKGP
jgi:hypothetical protein